MGDSQFRPLKDGMGCGSLSPRLTSNPRVHNIFINVSSVHYCGLTPVVPVLSRGKPPPSSMAETECFLPVAGLVDWAPEKSPGLTFCKSLVVFADATSSLLRELQCTFEMQPTVSVQATRFLTIRKPLGNLFETYL